MPSNNAYAKNDNRRNSTSSTSSFRSSMSAAKRFAQDTFGRKSEEDKAKAAEVKKFWKEERTAKSPAYGYGATPAYVTLGY